MRSDSRKPIDTLPPPMEALTTDQLTHLLQLVVGTLHAKPLSPDCLARLL